MADGENKAVTGSSPAGRGGAGTYIEGELGAFYMLAMLAGTEARGLPAARIDRITFQGADRGFSLDDLIIHATSPSGSAILEIQSKRTISFAPRDRIFQSVCEQIATSARSGLVADRHLLGIATQRTSFAISGAYQEVLEWARGADSGAAFFSRLAQEGVASQTMRGFIATFRTNLVDAGVEDDDDILWAILRRVLILEFDFEANAPMARAYGLALAQQVLAETEADRAGALWGNFIEIAIAIGKSGGTIDRDTLRTRLTDLHFRLSGDRDFTAARRRLAEMADFALRDVGTMVGGIRLSRLPIIAALDEARDAGRFVELRGGAGVGKSGVLRHLAERVAREGHVLVLDPVGTPAGGWSSLAQHLGVTATAHDFLQDLAASGGGVIFIDSLEMFIAPESRRTVNDMLRAAAAIPGFSVVCTSRPEFGQDGDDWLAPDAIQAFGPVSQVAVDDLSEAEVEHLRRASPDLAALLAPGHPAAGIARNLYRLSRLQRLPGAAAIRTEAELVGYWWRTGDGAPGPAVREAQRMLSDLADAALAGASTIEVRVDSAARTHLLRTASLRETARDVLAFYHDVLRDWAIGHRLREDPGLLGSLDLTVPVSPRLARGVEMAARFALEGEAGPQAWIALLNRLSGPGIHSSWRRQAVLAIMRSERAPDLLDGCTPDLLAKGGGLFNELTAAIVAVDTVAMSDLLGASVTVAVPKSLRSAISPAAIQLLQWVIRHGLEIPIQAITAVLKLVEIQCAIVTSAPKFAAAVAEMLFMWLRQLDLDETAVEIPYPDDAPRLGSQPYKRMIEELRTFAFLFASSAADSTRAYLQAVAAERDTYKVNAIRPFSKVLASVAPQELADLIAGSLIEPVRRGIARREPGYKAMTFADTDYLAASPAQPPFLDLLETAPAIGLDLIHRLVSHAVAYWSEGRDTSNNGFTLVFDEGPRFFPWVDTYLWSREQAREYSVASALKALEAWGHLRVERGDAVTDVIADILGPEGSCAAYLLVAVDVLISHWPKTRAAAVPFVSSPHLLSFDRTRQIHDSISGDRGTFRDEPAGPVRLADLRQRSSRATPLEGLIAGYFGRHTAEATAAADAARDRLTAAVTELGAYGDDDDFADPAFMGAYALNMLDHANWVPMDDGRFMYRSPPAEARHLEHLSELRASLNTKTEMESKIHLATGDPAKSSAGLARNAVIYAEGGLPDGSDNDALQSRSTRLVATALIAARDGDDSLVDAKEAWIRAVIGCGLAEESDRGSGTNNMIQYNRPALSICALAHLWRRRGRGEDRASLLRAAARPDRCAPAAFFNVLGMIVAHDPRLLKAALRIGLRCCRWRWKPWDEDPEAEAGWLREKADAEEVAIQAEILWLDGGDEPDWPEMPDEKPSIRRATRICIPSPGEEDAAAAPVREDRATVHPDAKTAAHWMQLLTAPDAASLDWRYEPVDVYGDWSARLNGLGYEADTEIDREPFEWNLQFYTLAARALMDGPDSRFDTLMASIVALPDRSFGDVASTLVHAADVAYFKNASRPPQRAVELRLALVGRVLRLADWDRTPRLGDLSIGRDLGGVVGPVLMNNHGAFSDTRSYLVAASFDRIDPLLETLRPLLAGGPTHFVASCIMNMLMVAPRARHADFLLSAVDAWMSRFPTEQAIWQGLGIGRRIVEWFETVIVEEPALLGRDHPLRARMDTVLGALVALGVAEAYTLESRIAAVASASAPVTPTVG